jgi:hypothetical protein
MVHEGDRYFEHCYAADYQADVTPRDREACWLAWVASYTRHQPSNRVDYAMLRIEALQNGEPTPALPGLMETTRPPEDVASELAAVDAASGNTSDSLLMPTMDGDAGPVPNGCVSFCNSYESRCLERCTGRSVACRTGCERERAICQQGCH